MNPRRLHELTRAIKRLRFPSVVLLTLVPGLAIPTLFFDAVGDFYKLNVSLTDPARRLVNDGNAVETYMRYKVQSLPKLLTYNERAEKIVAERRWANDELHLDIPAARWDQLREQVPANLRTYQQMHVWNGGQYRDAEIRFRGDSGFHWLLPKKSFKLKTDKAALFRGHRNLNFTIKYPYRGVLVGRLAKDFGLLAPEGDPVKVFKNNQFYGIHRFLEEVDEGFLRNNRRMPGNVYKGEGLRATGDWHAGLLSYFLLYSPYVWPKLAIDNSLPDANRDDLANFSRLLALPEMDAHLEFRERFDLETVARNIAFNIFVNEWHSGDGNNLRWYVDPTDGKFYPIIWDGYAGTNARALANHPQSRTLLNHAYHRLGSDPRVMHRAFEFLYEHIAADNVIEKQCAPLREHLEANLDAVDVEELHTTFAITQDAFDGVCRSLEGNRKRLQQWLAATELETRGDGAYFEIGTPSPAGVFVRSLDLEFDGNVGEAPVTLDADFDRVMSDGDRPIVASVTPLSDSRYRVAFHDPLLVLPAYTGLNRLATSSIPYGLHLPMNSRVVAVDAENAITGENAIANDALASHYGELDTLHPWEFPADPAPEVIVFDHPIHEVRQDLVIPAHATVKILPGTRVVLGDDVTMRSFGRIEAEGTASEPITFTHAAPGTLWGVLALQGRGASGSRFRHVKFEHGSLARFGSTRYPGMVTVHRAKDVSFRDCEFANNLKGDDLFRAAHSEIDIIDTYFHHANSDAIDYDYSTGRIERNRFEAVGNDCIDLMTSSPDIIQNKIEECGDKGVSVGESSNPLIFNNLIVRAEIGIQLKDGSNPLVLHNTIARSGIGVHAYRKNWRYDEGGSARIYNSEIVMNEIPLRIDPRSKITIDSSIIDDFDPTSVPAARIALRNTWIRGKGDAQGTAPEPNSSVFARFAPLQFEPKIGRVVKGAVLERPEHASQDRFRDGFRFDALGWSITRDQKLYVEGKQLKADLKRSSVVLAKESSIDPLPNNPRLVAILAGSQPATIEVDLIGEETTTHQFEVAEHEALLALPLDGRSLERIEFRATTPVTLKIREFAILGDPSEDALALVSP